MEKRMDLIKEDSSSWSNVCRDLNLDIIRWTKSISSNEKNKYIIDDRHTFQFNSFGPSIKQLQLDGSFDYLPVKKSLEIDLEKLYKNEYTLEELLEYKESHLGFYQEKPLYLRIGKFGPYIEWNEEKMNIKGICVELNKLTVEDAISYIENKKIEETPIRGLSESSKTILRVLDVNTSLRKGKFGSYIYHKTTTMNKPKFITIKNLKLNVFECSKNELLKLVSL
jgi:topoisomerase IA-like protein